MPGASTSGWASELAYQAAAVEFFGLVSERSIVGRLAGLRRVPLRTRTVTATGGTTASWVGEGMAKPVTAAAFAAGTLDPLKVVAITVITKELLESSDPAAEGVVRADLLRATLAALDESFVDPSNGGTADVEPAAVTHGVSAIPSSGSVGTDIRALVAAFAGDLDAAFLILPPEQAVGASGAEHPRIGARGGDLAGIPTLTSRHVPAGVVALVDPAGIAVGEGPVAARVSTHGAVAMADDPESSPALVSLWQTNAVALLIERAVNWRVVRPGSVAVVKGANYGATSP